MRGLCPNCAHMKPMQNDRGGVFLLCGLSKMDPRYPKYPRLPVLSCGGFEAIRPCPKETTATEP